MLLVGSVRLQGYGDNLCCWKRWTFGDPLRTPNVQSKLRGPKSLSIAKNHPKPSQEFSEQFGASIHKIKGFSRNSPQKVHPNFAQNLGRQILGNTFSGLKKRFGLKGFPSHSSHCSWGLHPHCQYYGGQPGPSIRGGGTKSTRKRKHRSLTVPRICVMGVLRFRLFFVLLLEGDTPKLNTPKNVDSRNGQFLGIFSGVLIGRKHPSQDVIFSGQNVAKNAKNDHIT